MELEDALFKWVKTQSALTALIGASPERVRFYHGAAPQGTRSPFVVQQRSGLDVQTLACRIDGAVAVALQVDFYSSTAESMRSVARAFRTQLKPDNVNGTLGYPVWMGDGDSPSVAVKVKAAILENEFDGVDPDPGLHRRTQLWTFWIWEP